MLSLVAPGCEIIQIDGVTEGAACTALKAKEIIDDTKPLIIANSDQYIKWNSLETISNFNDFDVFYEMFYNTRAGDLCKQHFEHRGIGRQAFSAADIHSLALTHNSTALFVEQRIALPGVPAWIRYDGLFDEVPGQLLNAV